MNTLTGQERRLITYAAEGTEADLHKDGQRGVVRAEVLRDLCTGSGPGSKWKVLDGIRVAGARVTGRLDLSGAELAHAIHFRDCVFEEPVNLQQVTTAHAVEWEGGTLPGIIADRFESEADLIIQQAEILGPVSLHWANVGGDLRFTGSHLIQPGGQVINGGDLRVGGTLFLDGENFHAEGEVCLRSAHIVGDVDCRHGHFDNPAGHSIDAAHLVADGEVLCEQGFRSNGEVCLQWAQVQRLRATAGSFASDTALALHADALRALAGVYLDRKFRATATVRLVGANITGELCCTGGTFDNQSDLALHAERIVADDVYLDHGFEAHGEVRFTDAEVNRQFNATRGVMENPAGYALNADGLKCGGAVFLNDGFRSTGSVRLIGAEIRGELNCTGGSFNNHGGDALFADGLTTPGMVYLDNGFNADGRVRLARATIGRQLVCTAGVFDNQHGTALNLAGLVCPGDVLLKGGPESDGFRATGLVRIRGARITRDLDFTSAELHGDEGLDARGLQVGGQLIWQMAQAPEGRVDLSLADISRLQDALKSWPKKKYQLAGLIYQSASDDLDVAQRVGWLGQTETYNADAYQQLAQQYRAGGDEEAARKIHIASQRDLRKRGNLRWISKVWNWFLGWSVGYGYRLHRPFLFLLALGLIGWGLYFWGEHAGLIYASDKSGIVAPNCAKGYPCFNSFVYSYSNLIPVADFRESSFWLPNPRANSPWGALLMVYTWVTIAIGWLAGTAIIAGVTRFFRAR
jgi:adhesin HecA-like repeat protein